MRINSLWRITNNYKDTSWVWVFKTEDADYVFPITGKKFKLKSGETIDIEINQDEVQIGFRKSDITLSGWIAKPVKVKTDRDIALTEDKEISFPKHGMFDQVGKGHDGVFMTSAQSNNLARSAVVWGLGKIPTVGGAVSAVVGLLWKEIKPKMEDLIDQSEARMKSWVRGEINQLKRDDLEDISKGLMKNLNEYTSAKAKESRLFWLNTNISHFNTNMPFFASKKYTVGTLGLGVEIATMHIALLRERVLFADELDISEKERDGHIKTLEDTIDEYKNFVTEVAIPAENLWREKGIEVTNDIGLASNKGYYLRDTILRHTYFFSDRIIGNQRNTSNSVVIKSYFLRHALTSYENALMTNIGDTAELWELLKVNSEKKLQPISLDRLTWVGPCTGLLQKEGNEHGAVEDVKMETRGDISEIIVRAHNEVDYLKIIYRNGESSAIGNAEGGTEYKVKLAEGVHITKVETLWDWELAGIKFYKSDCSETEMFGNKTKTGRHKQIATLDNHILSGLKVEGKKEATIGNGISFGFILRPDFYEVNKELNH